MQSVTFAVGRGEASIEARRIDVTTWQEDAEEQRSYVTGPGTYTITVRNWQDFVRLCRALELGISEETLRERAASAAVGDVLAVMGGS